MLGISEKRILLRIIEFVIVFIIIITFFPAKKLNAALSSSYAGLAKNLYLTLIIILTALVLALIVNKIVRCLIPRHYKEAENDIVPPENKSLAKNKVRRAKGNKRDGMKREASWHSMLHSLGFLKTEQKKLADKLEREQRQRKIELERKIRKANERKIIEKKPKTGWLKIFRRKPSTKGDIKGPVQEVPIPQKKIEILQKSAPVAPKKSIEKKEGIFKRLFAKKDEIKNEIVLGKEPEKIEVPISADTQKKHGESIFRLISKRIDKFKQDKKRQAMKRERMKMREKERQLKKEGKKRMLEAISREDKAKRNAFVERIESEKMLKDEEKEARQRFGEVAKELSEKIQKKDSKLQEGEPEPPEDKAKRRIFENIRQLFHPGIIARYGIRRAEMKKLKMRRKDIGAERKNLEQAKKEFEQKKAQEEKLKRILDESQMKKREQQMKLEKELAKKVPKPAHKYEEKSKKHEEDLNKMREEMKMRKDASKKEEMRKKKEEELKRKRAEEERGMAEKLRQKQIEADKRKEEYKKKIEDEKRKEQAKMQQKAMIKEAHKKKLIEALHKAMLIKTKAAKAEDTEKAKRKDELISKEIYKMLEKMAGYYIRKDYESAKSTYSQINIKYGQLSEEGKAKMKPIINRVVNKISQPMITSFS